MFGGELVQEVNAIIPPGIVPASDALVDESGDAEIFAVLFAPLGFVEGKSFGGNVAERKRVGSNLSCENATAHCPPNAFA